MANYPDLIAKYYPNCGTITHGDPSDYANVEYVSGDPIPPQVDLDARDLDEYKKQQITALSAIAGSKITLGFQSDTLGTMYWYDSQEHDQLNLIGSVASGDDMLYPTRDVQYPNGTKTYRQHSNWQLQKVIRDGRTLKLTVLQTFTAVKEQILVAADEAAVDTAVAGVVWPS